MISVDQALCTGCEVCVDECPVGAITLANGKAVVDPALCDGCRSFDGALQSGRDKLCVEICPNGALTWVVEPVSEGAREMSLPVVVEPTVEVIPAEPREVVLRRRAVLPAVGSALTWVGREVVPRLAPLALDVLDAALDRRRDMRPGSSLSRGSEGKDRQRGGRRRRRKRGQE